MSRSHFCHFVFAFNSTRKNNAKRRILAKTTSAKLFSRSSLERVVIHIQIDGKSEKIHFYLKKFDLYLCLNKMCMCNVRKKLKVVKKLSKTLRLYGKFDHTDETYEGRPGIMLCSSHSVASTLHRHVSRDLII